MDMMKSLVLIFGVVGIFHAMGGLRDVQFIAVGIAAVILAIGYYAEKICNALQMSRVAQVPTQKEE